MRKTVITLSLILTLLATFAIASPMSGGMAGIPPMSVSSEFDFLASMVPHHQKASENASLALERSERSEVQQLAQKIIDAQGAEITQMKAWLTEWYPEGNRRQVTAKMNQTMISMVMPDLKTLSGDAFDQGFLESMTMHHQMAIQMVDSLLEQNLVEHEKVRTLAEEIRSSQEAEITQMQGYLKAWFGDTAAVGHSSH